VNIIHNLGLIVSSQFSVEGAVEDGGEKGVQLGGGLKFPSSRI
jgi:hypothetical protein